eukprot:7386821-Prymnesium_polylepis.1
MLRRRPAPHPLALRPPPRRRRRRRLPSRPPASRSRPASSRPVTPRPASGWGRLRSHHMSRSLSQGCRRRPRRRIVRISRRRRHRVARRPLSASFRPPRRCRSAPLAALRRSLG